jgi:hypothetical protein
MSFLRQQTAMAPRGDRLRLEVSTIGVTWLRRDGGAGLSTPVSKTIIARVSDTVNKAVASPSLLEKYAVNGSEPVGGTVEAFGAFIQFLGERRAAKDAKHGAALPARPFDLNLCDVLHLVCEIAPRCWRRQWLTIVVVKRNGFLHHLTQLVEDSFFILAMTATVNQARRASNKAFIFFRPLYNLCVPCTFFHDFDSSTARFTARTW